MPPHRLGEPVRDRRRESVGGVDDRGAATAVRGDTERGDARVPLLEGHDVRDVGAAPPVDGLVVVADDAEFDAGPGEELDQPLLGGVHVLVLVDDQVAEVRVNRGGDRRFLELLYRPGDLLPVGQQAVPVERGVVAREDGAERLRH